MLSKFDKAIHYTQSSDNIDFKVSKTELVNQLTSCNLIDDQKSNKKSFEPHSFTIKSIEIKHVVFKMIYLTFLSRYIPSYINLSLDLLILPGMGR